MFFLESGSSSRPYRVDITVCRSFLDRLTGALIDGRIPFRSALLFPDCRSIHTFFMRSSIAVLMFDEEGTVLDYRPKVPPFRVIKGPSETVGLLELAPNRLDDVDESAGDLRIRFSPSDAAEAGYPDLEHDN